MVQEKDDVALIFDGEDVGMPGSTGCLIINTNVKLPAWSNHLVIDTDIANISISEVRSTVEKLDLVSSAGSAYMKRSAMQISDLSVQLGSGDFLCEESSPSRAQTIELKKGALVA